MWKADYKKLSGQETTRPCLFGPNGDIYFSELHDASYAASECNEAFELGRSTLLPLLRELAESLKLISEHSCMCSSNDLNEDGTREFCSSCIATKAIAKAKKEIL
jgi:hypothetical protein